MATAAFKSTTRRTSIGGATTAAATTTTTPSSNSNLNSSSSHHRRSRSVSRFSHRNSPEEPPSASRKGKFVNTVRGSGFAEISLDDLAIEMFSSSDIGDGDCGSHSHSHQRGRKSSASATEVSSSRRGRSVSRRGNGKVDNQSMATDCVSRRRRSLSVVRNYQISDSENEHIGKHKSQVNSKDLSIWSKEKPQTQPASSNQQRGLRRCSSQKDFLRSYDGYSSYSSTLTDDGENDTFYNANRTTKGMQAAFGQNKIKAQNQLSVLGSNNDRKSADSDNLKTVSTIRKNYKTKLEESEKRRQELLAKIMLEEERGKELKKIVGDLLPNPRSSPVKRATRGRKRSTDRNKMPKQLEEEVDKIIEDFISSFEETDMSSFDGERSDTSSVLGGALKPTLVCGDIESYKSSLRCELPPEEMDGVVLPWLKWETGNDGTPLLSTDNKQQPTTPRTVLRETQEMTASVEHEQSSGSKSSRGSWSPGVANSFSLDLGQISIAGEVESSKSQLLSQVPRKPRVDIDNYIKLSSNESLLSERWKQRGRIDSGGLLICNSGRIGDFLL